MRSCKNTAAPVRRSQRRLISSSRRSCGPCVNGHTRQATGFARGITIRPAASQHPARRTAARQETKLHFVIALDLNGPGQRLAAPTSGLTGEDQFVERWFRPAFKFAGMQADDVPPTPGQSGPVLAVKLAASSVPHICLRPVASRRRSSAFGQGRQQARGLTRLPFPAAGHDRRAQDGARRQPCRHFAPAPAE